MRWRCRRTCPAFGVWRSPQAAHDRHSIIGRRYGVIRRTLATGTADAVNGGAGGVQRGARARGGRAHGRPSARRAASQERTTTMADIIMVETKIDSQDGAHKIAQAL